MENKKITVVNRGKIAYLYMNNIYEDRIVEITRDGKEQLAFEFTLTSVIEDLLHEFDCDDKLKKYNSCFKQIAFTIRKYKDSKFYK